MPDAEEMGKLKVLPGNRQRVPVKLDGLITLYSRGLLRSEKLGILYLPRDIMEVHQKIYSMCRDWLAADEGAESGSVPF